MNTTTTRISEAPARRFPDLDPRQPRIVTDAITWLVTKRVPSPLSPIEQVAEALATVYTGYLTRASR